MEQLKENILFLDCSSGISGDMMVAALLDLGADEEVLRSMLSSFEISGYEIRISHVNKSGIRACDFNVVLEQDNHDHDLEYLHRTHAGHDHNEHAESGEHTHKCKTEQLHTQQHERNLNDIVEILKQSSMTPRALEIALRIFHILAEAEAKVHGKSLDKVHFHEVGAIDSIIDVASVAICMDQLGIEDVIITGLTEGCGQIRCQHGLLPVPVPATLAILERYPIPLHICDVKGELVTPTGAAIAAALCTENRLPERFTIKKTGMGAGKRDYPTAGIVRAVLIDTLQ